MLGKEAGRASFRRRVVRVVRVVRVAGGGVQEALLEGLEEGLEGGVRREMERRRTEEKGGCSPSILPCN